MTPCYQRYAPIINYFAAADVNDLSQYLSERVSFKRADSVSDRSCDHMKNPPIPIEAWYDWVSSRELNDSKSISRFLLVMVSLKGRTMESQKEPNRVSIVPSYRCLCLWTHRILAMV